MGTPKRKFVEFEKVFESPKLGEKIRLLEIGKKTGKSLNFGKFSYVLEDAKKILFPLVEWLNKPLSSEAMFANNPLPKVYQNRRGVHLFGSFFIDIWLLRSGMWFVRIRDYDKRWILREMDCFQLATIIIDRREDFLKDSLRGKDFLDEFPFLKEIAVYNAMFVHVLSCFFKSVEELVIKREEKLRVMREWLELLGDFGKSLDPLISQGKREALKHYEIWEETERGVYSRTQTYFSHGALKPFWEIIEKRMQDGSGYKESIGTYSAESLFDILQRIGWAVGDIEKAESMGKTDAESLWGYNTGRLPFTEEEMAVLEEFAKSITK